MKGVFVFANLFIVGLFTATVLADQAGCWGEFFHHQFDMPDWVYRNMDECTHVNQVAKATIQSKNVSQVADKLIAEHLFEVTLEPGCYSKGEVKFNGSVSAQRGISISAADSQGTTVSSKASFGFSLGQLAKNSVETELGWSHSWNWTATNTYTEDVNLTLGADRSWPREGSRKVTGPASVYQLCQVYKKEATVAVEARYEHKCTTTFFDGFERDTPYGNHGKIAFTATATSYIPGKTVLGPFVEKGDIEIGCGG